MNSLNKKIGIFIKISCLGVLWVPEAFLALFLVSVCPKDPAPRVKPLLFRVGKAQAVSAWEA